MKSAPISITLPKTDLINGKPESQINYSYQSVHTTNRSAAAKTEVRRAELKTFRALSRDFFAREAGRESLREMVVFGWIMAVAAWPLGVTLNQLGTMMISPPHVPW